MKIQRKIWNYILIFVLGMMGMITIIVRNVVHKS